MKPLPSPVLLLLLPLALWWSPRAPLLGAMAGQTRAVQQPSCEYRHCYQVNNSGSGQGSLYQVLKTAHDHHLTSKESVEIRMSKGTYNLTHNDLLTFEAWRNLSLTGSGKKLTRLECQRDVGLVFRNSTHVTLRGLSLTHCARFLNTTSANLTRTHSDHSHSHSSTEFVVSRSGVHFSSCSNLTLSDILVFNSSGMGVTVYNSNGTNLFNSCEFVSNHLNADDSYPGGGGVVIETSHCVPGDVGCQDNQMYLETHDSSYTFRSCDFISNRATSHYLPFDSVYPHGRRHVGLGRGGGLAVIFKGHALRNSVTLDNCEFSTNRAEWGGAVYLAFGDTSVNNSVLVDHSLFYSNNFRDGTDPDKDNVTVGGALRVEFVSFPPDPALWPGFVGNVSNNSVLIRDTLFNRNFGTWGGGVSFTTTRDLPGQLHANSLAFESCKFTINQANMAGSAVDVSSWKPDVVDSSEAFVRPSFQDCIFESNTLPFNNITNYPMGIGAVYIADIPTQFLGSTQFHSNDGTALVVSETFVTVTPSSSLNFTGNSGRRGGALAFIGSAWLVADKDTRFLFTGNHVGTYGLGGAVYSVHFGEHDLVYDQNCFFRYRDFALPPSRWNTTFEFRDNMADGQPNSIYTTSSLPCTWGVAERLPAPPSSSSGGGGGGVGPFCENDTWIFHGDGRNYSNEIATGPSQIVVRQIDIDVVPGWSVPLNTNTLNDFGHPMPSVLAASPARDDNGYGRGDISIADSTQYVSDDHVVIHGEEGTQANLLLTTLDPRVVASEVTVHVQPCPPGFRSVPCPASSSSSSSPESEGSEVVFSGKTCDCKCWDVPGIQCSDETREAFLEHLHCISLDKNSSSGAMVVARCPYNLARNTSLHDLTIENLNSTCAKFNRTGYLCSQCTEGYGVAINTYDFRCVDCRGHEKYDWALYLLVELGPITVICFLVILLDVSITTPAMNAFVFFSQITSITFSTNLYIWFFGAESVNQALPHILFTLYGLMNLEVLRDVLPGICLHEGLQPLHILVINYVKALYPMVLLGICYVCIQLYDRNFRLLHFLWQPFRKCQKAVYKSCKPRTSVVDAFATLIVLSYSKFMYVSFPFLNLVSVYRLDSSGDNWNGTGTSPEPEKYRYYFDPAQMLRHPANVVYFLLGVVVLVVFVGCPPLFLILYPLRTVQACVSRLNARVQLRLHTFADIFLGAFRDGTESSGGVNWAGGGRKRGGRDCRWFAGLYLLLRILFLALYAVETDPTILYLVQQILCTLVLLLFATVRPYKEDLYNKLDTGFFALMAVLNSLSFYNSHLYTTRKDISPAVFYINYLLMFLPILYLTVFMFHQILTWRGGSCCCTKRHRDGNVTTPRSKGPTFSEPFTDDSYVSSEGDPDRLSESDKLLPDRFVNPQNYCTLDRLSSKRSGSQSQSGNSVSREMRQHGGAAWAGRGEGPPKGDGNKQPNTDIGAVGVAGGHGSIQVQSHPDTV